MKRLLILGSLVGAVVFSVFASSLAGAQATNVNNFHISSFDIQYELSRNSEGRSVLRATETITAEFPQHNQNRGIERAIPRDYNGHSLNMSIQSVRDSENRTLEYTTRSDGDFTVLRIGDPSQYVHGTQVYRIAYTLHDVTRFYANTDRDEWYWDTNGTLWKVPIEQLTIAVTMDESLRDARAAAPMCYRGTQGASGACEITQPDDGTYTVAAANFGKGENVTVAFGFEKGTFAEYAASLQETLLSVWFIAQIVATAVAVIAVIIFSVLFSRRTWRTAETSTIVAEYIPPRDASVTTSSHIVRKGTHAFTAQLIDLAVRRYVSIVETKPKSLFRAAEYDLVIQKDISELREEEQEIIRDMFSGVPKVGDRLQLSSLKNNHSYSRSLLDNDKKLHRLIKTSYDLRGKSATVSSFFSKWAIALAVVAVLTLSPALVVAAIIVGAMSATIQPLTDKGLELRRYLLGFDRYIKASEAERLAFLQGPDTAQKVGYLVDVNDSGQLVKLYERALPYAILFGHESEWSRRLGVMYQRTETTPDWYTGTAAFSAASFVTSVSSFSSATTAYSSYSDSVSSSGGSSGGGFSGGGGGGGGGGGW